MIEQRRRPSRGLLRRGLLTALLAGVVALSWTQFLDETALSNTDTTFKRALATFAVARALNGVISVAQGTELAVQPVGVGVTLTIGEILDPLNDLVERFSWLALLACVSLGTQILLAEMVTTPVLSAALTVTGLAWMASLWWPGRGVARTVLMRAFTVTVFARFLFPLITLATGWVDATFLADRQQASLSQIEMTRQHIEDLQENPPPPEETAADDTSWYQRLGGFLDDQRQSLMANAHIPAMRERVEGAIAELINLFVIFTVQTILVPTGTLLLAYWGFLCLWRWSWQNPAARGQ